MAQGAHPIGVGGPLVGLDGEGALAGGGRRGDGIEDIAHSAVQAHAFQAGQGQQHGVGVARLELG